MLKQTVTYTDFDNNKQTETLYFNITKSELMTNIVLKDRLEKSARMLQGADRELTPDEVDEIVQLLKLFMKLSYGVRSEDGRRFKKSEELWEEFTETAVYDSFFMSLFMEPNKAMEFLINVVPQDLREAAEQEMKNNTPKFQEAMAAIQARDDKAEQPEPEPEPANPVAWFNAQS